MVWAEQIGFGVRFAELSTDALDRIELFVDSQTRCEQTPEPSEGSSTASVSASSPIS